ncbi:MAG: hypothetical protein FJ306_03975 [Planctomycetes bacterium]|nr:hypothetical protein [Planctomycetota bacterium]
MSYTAPSSGKPAASLRARRVSLLAAVCLAAICFWVVWGGGAGVQPAAPSVAVPGQTAPVAQGLQARAQPEVTAPLPREKVYLLRDRGTRRALGQRRVEVNGRDYLTSADGYFTVSDGVAVERIGACKGDPPWTTGEHTIDDGVVDVVCFGVLRIAAQTDVGLSGKVSGRVGVTGDVVEVPFDGSKAEVRVTTDRSWVVRVDAPAHVVVTPGAPRLVGTQKPVKGGMEISVPDAKELGRGVPESAPFTPGPGEVMVVSIDVPSRVALEVLFDGLASGTRANVHVRRRLGTDESIMPTWLPVFTQECELRNDVPLVVGADLPQGRYRVTMRSLAPGDVQCAMWDEVVGPGTFMMRQSRQVERHSLRIAARDRWDGTRSLLVHIVVHDFGSIRWTADMPCDFMVHGLPGATGEISIDVDKKMQGGLLPFDATSGRAVVYSP